MGEYNTHVLIIGSGLAGIYSALNIDKRFNVTIISKETLIENNSYLAQGGIAACIKDDDSYSLHIEDTLKAGSRLNDISSLECLVKSGPKDIDNLINLGVKFDLDDNGNVKTTMEGGHSRRRILHAGGDATGREIMDALVKELKTRDNIKILDNTMALDLLVEDNRCIGAKVLIDDKVVDIKSKISILATGGIGEVYNNSTNSHVATGDGIAMAYRAGCTIKNMEFVQFHPTAYYSKGKGKKFLISEAVRGEGGILRNNYGERFMKKYHNDLELAPRDVVSQGIFKELERTDSKYVYIDITHRDKEYLINRFPTIYNRLLKEGIDISKEYIPVAPVEHYSVGGIVVDIDGRTNIKGLYACGESSNTGIHGGNRLASNSLLECVVFGGRISNEINKTISKENLEGFKEYDLEVTYLKDEIIERYKEIIKETMERYVSIIRSEDGLLKAKEIIDKILENLKEKSNYKRSYFEALNMATVAKLIIRDSILRRESIGCHYRIDDKEYKVI